MGHHLVIPMGFSALPRFPRSFAACIRAKSPVKTRPQPMVKRASPVSAMGTSRRWTSGVQRKKRGKNVGFSWDFTGCLHEVPWELGEWALKLLFIGVIPIKYHYIPLNIIVIGVFNMFTWDLMILNGELNDMSWDCSWPLNDTLQFC